MPYRFVVGHFCISQPILAHVLFRKITPKFVLRIKEEKMMSTHTSNIKSTLFSYLIGQESQPILAHFKAL